jgi:hypothetical protein
LFAAGAGCSVLVLIALACVNYGTPANCYTKAAAIFSADLIISSLLVFVLYFGWG